MKYGIVIKERFWNCPWFHFEEITPQGDSLQFVGRAKWEG
jgi:hypothetical protein